MSKNLVYVAQPIDMGRVDPGLAEFAIGQLQAAGLSSYDPLAAFNVTGAPHGLISRVNGSAMDASTGAVAFLPSYAFSVGVPAEISYLVTRMKPTLIVTDLAAKSYVVAGWADHDHVKVIALTEDDVTDGVSWLISKIAEYDMLGLTEGNEPIVFGRENPDAILPTRGYDTDAGYDLYTVGDHVLAPGQFVDVSCGVSVDLPGGTWGLITGRSSTLRKRGLLVAQGVIDEDYTGPLYAGCKNLTDEVVTVKDGERVAQLILHEAPGQLYAPAWGTPRAKQRGSNGFGSTGL